MIDPVNEILRDLIQSRIPSLAGPSQVAFEPPNEEWRQNLITAGEERVNLFLYHLTENLHLRTNERLRTFENGWIRESRPPGRVDCRYIVTAWSPVSFTPPAVEPTRDEHVLLYTVLDVLMRHQPLVAAAVYQANVAIPSGRTLNSVPAAIRDGELPMTVALPDGMQERGDFWSTMKISWRPSVELVVTVPILLQQEDIESPMVTTLSGEYMQSAGVSAEALVSIGGRILTPASGAVGGAWVQITGMQPAELQAINRRLVTRGDGRFLFDSLRPGQYQLRAVAAGLGDIARDVQLPSASGEYDLRFP